jgi:cell division protein FtsZ
VPSAPVPSAPILSAPVADDVAAPEPAEDIPAGYEAPSPEPPRPDRAAVAADAVDSYRPAHTTEAKTFDVASTRRRPVVFEEDDDLDVPDFLK